MITAPIDFKSTESAHGLSELVKAAIDHPQDPVHLEALFHAAVRCDKVAEAVAVLDRLQKSYPWHQALRKLRIAARLHLKDYASAMDAVETLLAFSKPDKELVSSALAVRKHLGPRTLSGCSPKGRTVSLCMIVRNEQDFLGPCLNSIKHVVDEIIVVDTGSTDYTADIAGIYGARVYDYKWSDDFSAARNTALEKAEGDWILILDADEIIARRDHEKLRALVESPHSSGKAFTLRTRNYSNLANTLGWQANDGEYRKQEAALGWFPTDKVRLFEGSRRIRFVYPVHELVDPSVRMAGMTIERCPIPVHHYGHLNETRNLRKARQYFDLGYAKLEQLSGNRVALRELAIQAGQLEQWSEAMALWERFLELTPNSGEAYANMAGACWQLQDYDQGMRFSKRAIKVEPGLKEGHFNLAANLIMTGQAGEAVRILKGMLLRHPDYLSAAFMLGAALALKDDLGHSRSIFKDLEGKISRQALTIAVFDLVEKFKRNAMADGVRRLLTAADISVAESSGNGAPC